MFRAAATKLSAGNRICATNVYNVGQSELNIQSVRWRRIRRPIELGTSKSKLYRIPQHNPPPPVEAAELKRLDSIYR